MSDLHELCGLNQRPIDSRYIENLKFYLKSGIPATYTIEEAYNYIKGIEEEPTTTTTPLHLICKAIPKDLTDEETKTVSQMVELLFEYGAGWSLMDIDNKTPGCILVDRGLTDLVVYQQIVESGIRAEVLLRKVNELNVEFVSDEEDIPDLVVEGEEGETESTKDNKESSDKEGKYEENEDKENENNDPSSNQKAYLNSELEYKDDALVTKDRNDGVMMSWETELMKLGAETLFKGDSLPNGEKDKEVNILNIGFGMGIIDTMINAKNPTKHYICEAHQDVLAKMKKDGWYEKSNVVVLEGRWQDRLDELLSSGSVFFNGIYYDTYSEHYEDMLELFNYVVGLLKPHGVFSFFNGLGADRQVIYDVYKQLVAMDLSNYGLSLKYDNVQVPESTLQNASSSKPKSVWDDIKREYWSCPTYYHPEARFTDV